MEIRWEYQNKISKNVKLNTKYFDETKTIEIIIKSVTEVEDKNERAKIIRDYHGPENGHLGISKTYERISQKFYWEKMKKYIEDYTKSCKDCQLTKRAQYNNQADGVLIHPPRTLGERITIDHVGPFPVSTEGFKYILTIQDQLTKILTLIPVKLTQAVETAERLLEN